MDAKYIKRYKTKYFIESLIKEKEKLDKEGKYYDIDDLIVNIKEKEKKRYVGVENFDVIAEEIFVSLKKEFEKFKNIKIKKNFFEELGVIAENLRPSLINEIEAKEKEFEKFRELKKFKDIEIRKKFFEELGVIEENLKLSLINEIEAKAFEKI